MTQPCPICARPTPLNARYPRAVCAACAKRVADAGGRALRLFQALPDGRYAARYVDTGEAYDSQNCFIDGVPCWAVEGRFGGIVVQAL